MSAAEHIVVPVCFVRRAMPGDTWLMLPTVRQADIDELAALGVTPERCMRDGIAYSQQAWTCFIHGEPACVYGMADHGDFGVPWAVVSTTAERYPLPFLRESRRFIDSLTMRLENYVDTRNTQAIAWLRWLGFTIDDPRPVGVNGELFHRFWRCATGG